VAVGGIANLDLHECQAHIWQCVDYLTRQAARAAWL
jgi:hypothetical protein